MGFVFGKPQLLYSQVIPVNHEIKMSTPGCAINRDR
jgi:hypothetical protein